MTAAATPRAPKAPKERLTLKDTTDLLEYLNQWVEDHVDEIELSGGALPDDLATLLDEIVAADRSKVDAIIAKLEEFGGYASVSKAAKDRNARREKVWNNTIAAMKASVLRQLDRRGVDWLLSTTGHMLRRQTNGGTPEVLCAFADAELLAAANFDPEETLFDDAPEPVAFALVPWIRIERKATLDKKALVEAYTARRDELADLALHRYASAADIPDEQAALIAQFSAEADGATKADVERAELETLEMLRNKYVADGLSAAFPGITISRGCHLRID